MHLLKKMKFKKGDIAVIKEKIKVPAATIPAGAAVVITARDIIFRCYDILYEGEEFFCFTDKDFR